MLRKFYPSPVAFDRAEKIIKVPVNGDLLAVATNAVMGYRFVESSKVIITRVVLDITTVATGACTVDVGYTATSINTTSDSLLDGIDANAATGVFDSMNAALDTGANAKAQLAAVNGFVTITEKTGDAEGLRGNLYIHYVVV